MTNGQRHGQKSLSNGSDDQHLVTEHHVSLLSLRTAVSQCIRFEWHAVAECQWRRKSACSASIATVVPHSPAKSGTSHEGLIEAIAAHPSLKDSALRTPPQSLSSQTNRPVHRLCPHSLPSKTLSTSLNPRPHPPPANPHDKAHP